MEPLFPVAPESLETASVEELETYIAASAARAREISEAPAEFLVDGRTTADLVREMTESVEAVEAARAELASRAPAETEPVEDDPVVEAVDAEVTDADREALEALSARAEAEPDPPPADEPDPAEAVELEPVVAAAVPAPARRRSLPAPARSRQAAPAERALSLVAAAPNLGFEVGDDVDLEAVGRMMIQKRKNFGHIGKDTKGERIPLARVDWSDGYPEERRLAVDEQTNMAIVASAIRQVEIQRELERRRTDSLTASGGLCAPVTPYYNLPVIAQASRPVRDSLASFNASRGGLRFARPASLADIDTAIGTITAAEDAIGGTTGSKPCQVIACPPFSEVDVQAISHCLQTGNLTSRTFPELLAQWTELTLAAHARTAETALLDGIAAASRDVSGVDRALGASAELPSQLITQAAGLRSRHRMAPDAVLRVLLPNWILDELVSDTYRRQFDQFGMTRDQFVGVLRSANIEPSFYLDSESGGGQVFGAQGTGAMLGFPPIVRWYMFPEGSFLFLDGGSLELGLVRDSILNETNDFQIFGETWEAVAFIGIESIAGASTISDCGATSAPATVVCA